MSPAKNSFYGINSTVLRALTNPKKYQSNGSLISTGGLDFRAISTVVIVAAKREKKDNEPSIVINRDIEFYAANEIENDGGSRKFKVIK